MAQTEPSTAAKYCGECGAGLRESAEYCPECGVGVSDGGDKTRISQSGYKVTGIVASMVALLFLPPLFGLLALFCGVQLFRHYDERMGLFISMLAVAATGVGMYVGYMLFTA